MQRGILFILIICLPVLSESFDEKLFLDINGVRHASLDVISPVLYYSQVLEPVPAAIMLYQGWTRKNDNQWRNGVWATLGFTGVALVSQGLKISIQRKRPIYEVPASEGNHHDPEIIDNIFPSEKYSFPSMSTALAFYSGKYYGEKWGYAWAWYTYGLLLGWSRLYEGAHYPSDVVAGAALGYLGGWLTIKLSNDSGWPGPLQKLKLSAHPISFGANNGLKFKASW